MRKFLTSHIACLALIGLMENSMAFAASSSGNGFAGIDFSGIESLVIDGAGSKLNLRANGSPSPRMQLEKDGWNSGFCKPSVDVSRSGSTLRVRVLQSGVLTGILGECNVTLSMDLPENLNLSVNQSDTVTIVDGTVQDLTVKSSNAVVSFAGRSRTIDVDSARLKMDLKGDARQVSVKASQALAELEFEPAAYPRSVSIDADVLVANIGFPEDTVVEKSISAPISIFSNALRQTGVPTAKITIRSDVLKGAIYAVGNFVSAGLSGR